MHTFTIPLTRPQLEAARAKLAKSGTFLVGDTGILNGSGVTLDVSYSDVNGTLTCSVQSKPFYVSNGFVESKVREWFA